MKKLEKQNNRSLSLLFTSTLLLRCDIEICPNAGLPVQYLGFTDI